MRLDDEQDISLEEILVDARTFPQLGADAPVPLPRHRAGGSQDDPLRIDHSVRIDHPVRIDVPDTCLRLVDGPLVGL